MTHRISTSAFTLATEEEGVHRVALALHGELDIAVATEAHELLERALERGDDVEIDLSGLEFVDSSGLVVLLRASQQAAALGRRCTLIGPFQSQVRRVLRLSGLEQLLPAS